MLSQVLYRSGLAAFRPRKRLLPTTLSLFLCLLSLTETHAQTRPEGEGRVVAVDEAKGSVTLDHGPIPGLMPAMRMAFPVQRIEILQDIAVGEMVRFFLVPRGAEWVIDRMERKQAAGQTAPVAIAAPEFTRPGLHGGSLRLGDLRGKVVVLNFWATWCLPCRKEMPALETLYQRHKAHGLEVVGVNMDTLSTTSVAKFVKEVTVSFPIGLDPSWSVAQLYRVTGLPTTYLIDGAGNVVAREIGERDWGDQISEAAVKRLLPQGDRGRKEGQP